jgi:hypothetical protein
LLLLLLPQQRPLRQVHPQPKPDCPDRCCAHMELLPLPLPLLLRSLLRW